MKIYNAHTIETFSSFLDIITFIRGKIISFKIQLIKIKLTLSNPIKSISDI